MRDVLDLFGDLPDYPGKRKPKNRPDTIAESRREMDDIFRGVPKKTMVVKGIPTDLYTVGALARIVGRSVKTIRKWEDKGWLPKPTYRTSKASGSPKVNGSEKGYRLYTRAQIEVVYEALENNNLMGSRNGHWQEADNWLSFIEQVRANWPK